MGVAAEPDHSERTVIVRRDPLLGATFDRRFRVDAKIAAGGFGAIYRATHVNSGHEFALKMLHANLTSDPHVVARFRREGDALTRLRDPHTITAYELGEAPDGTLYIVMELLRGESLYDRFRGNGSMPWRRVVSIARAVCSSLAEAHAHGIIHRDLKPTNIHLEPRGAERDFVKVLDFGIAKILHGSEIDSSDLTQAGQMIGTLDYMSPEQMVGGMCTATSDIYTLGIVMYEMIAGRKPFEDANTAAAALAAVLTTTPLRLSELVAVPPSVDHMVMRCLERQQAERFQSAVELAAALDDILSGRDYIGSVSRSEEGTTTPMPVLRTSSPQLPPMRGSSPPQRASSMPLAPPQRDSSAQIPPASPPLSPSIPPFSPQVPPRRASAPQVLAAPPRASAPQIPSSPVPASYLPAPGSAPFTPAPYRPASPRRAATAGAAPETQHTQPPAPEDSSEQGRESFQDLSIAREIAVTPTSAAVAEASPSRAAAAAPPQRSSASKLTPSSMQPAPVARPSATGTALGADGAAAAESADDAAAATAPKPRLAAPRPRTHSTPLTSTPKSLREAYPTIHLQPPSASRPPLTAFDDRPTTAIGAVTPDGEEVPQRDPMVRRLLLGLGVLIAVVAVIIVVADTLYR